MNPIIILWAHPRSMSTAIERVMRERGDFECLHEPFLHYYYIERTGKQLPHFDSEQRHPTSYADTRDWLLDQAATKAVFAKDMSYYVMPELLQDTEFCRRVKHCFLIRHPLRSILSYYKLDAEVEMHEIGLESQWQHLAGLREMGIDGVVLEAEAVQQDTSGAMKVFWQALGLDYREQALSWNEESTPEDWQYVQGWHENVSDSKGIKQQTTADQEKYRLEFESLCRQAPQLQDFLDHHLPFYERLKQQSITASEHAGCVN